MSAVQVLGAAGMGIAGRFGNPLDNPLVGGAAGALSWQQGGLSSKSLPLREPRSRRPGSAWLSAEEVAYLVLAGECRDAGVSVPAHFSGQAIESAVASVERWRAEGRIFAIHDLYPRYQFDASGRPLAVIERILARLGKGDVLRVGNWISAPNLALLGRRPRELLLIAPADVLGALEVTAREGAVA